MSIQKFQIYTQAISNPRNPDAGSGGQPLAGDISYQLVVNPSNISTLANNFRQLVLRGLLYVPDLRPDSPCINSTAQYIPANVTRLSDFPPSPTSQIPGVAIAPWTDSTCALAYLNAVRTSTQLVAAMVFYLPDGSTAQPPGPNDPIWNLNGNTNWQGQLVFPVYALPGLIGSTLMAQSALYSGNITDVPNGAQLAQQYGVFDYIRLVVLIQAGENTTILPSLWVFLLIVLGVLLGVIGVTSLIMHLIQRHRRSSLRRRITNGEVDLDVLGIKRLTVPQEVLDRMPLYKYGSESSQTAAAPGVARTHRFKTSTVSSQNENASRYRPDALAQPMCAICLDDFVVASTEGETVTEATMVRELPCRHIYHPDCVDTFLRENSSLCPTCKTSALPVGYCPNIITNAMITRERRARRDAAAARAGVSEGSAQPSRFAFMSRLRPSNPAHPPVPQDTELGPLPANNTSAEPAAVPAPVAALPLSAPNRREWARQRAVAMVGGRTAVEGETDGQTRSGGVGRFFGRIFPTGRAT